MTICIELLVFITIKNSRFENHVNLCFWIFFEEKRSKNELAVVLSVQIRPLLLFLLLLLLLRLQAGKQLIKLCVFKRLTILCVFHGETLDGATVIYCQTLQALSCFAQLCAVVITMIKHSY